jgi:hypothetical protein
MDPSTGDRLRRRAIPLDPGRHERLAVDELSVYGVYVRDRRALPAAAEDGTFTFLNSTGLVQFRGRASPCPNRPHPSHAPDPLA